MKEWIINNKKVERFLLERELPDARVVADGGTIDQDVVAVKAVDHVTQVALETCRCIHLQEHLPDILDLELCRAEHHPRGWVVANPVHSMHLASQLEESAPAEKHSKQPPILYGEEQQRTIALNTEGIVEYWCPLDGYSAVIHDDTAVEKMEHMPTLSNIHKTPTHQSQASTASSVNNSHLEKQKKQQQHQSQSIQAMSSSGAQSFRSGTSFDSTSKRDASSSINTAVPKAALSSNSVPLVAPKNAPSTQKAKPPVPKPTSVSSKDKTSSNTVTKGGIQSPEKVSSSGIDATRTTSVGSSELHTKSIADESTSSTVEPKPMATTSADQTSSPFDDDGMAQIYELPDQQYNHLRLEEDRIRLIRRSLSSHRLNKKKVENKKKRKRDNDIYKTPGIPGWRPSAPKELNSEQEKQWNEATAESRARVERWMDTFRLSRESYWNERTPKKETSNGGFYLPVEFSSVMRCCEICKNKPQGDKFWDGNGRTIKKPTKPRRSLCCDELMQCLDCSFIGCSPQSVAPDSRQHILQHLLISGHNFAVSCGERAQVFCFRCGDFVYHDLFEQEKQRIDFTKTLPFMSWKHHMVQRSFDPFQFIKTQDYGIVWRGLIATYPSLVPDEHIRATQLTSRRQSLFEGHVQEKWLVTKPNALNFASTQCLLDGPKKYRIVAPVGMYNLGNTCFKSAILQCLVHCAPLQRYFLHDIGHHYQSCELYRQKEALKKKKKKNGSSSEEAKRLDSVCLACEMDKIYLSYYGSTIGKDVLDAIAEASDKKSDDNELNDETNMPKGDPLIISEMLTASWKSGGMDNLARYMQHDAHEFLNSFLELMGKHASQHRDRILTSINTVREDNATVPKTDDTQNDIVKSLFEGSLRSVLLCEECGGKRKQNEAFLNISLTLAEEVEASRAEGGISKKQLSVETCLEHFILPEKLGDSVQCPSCERKTPTKKQHTFAKLPKILCLHLKRFDAARNRKIDEFVSFPAHGLNMGKYLSHWCEVSSVPPDFQDDSRIVEPMVLYDLFGTVNHIGNMQSGHYVTNVKVGDSWYHCNDAHVGRAGGVDEVLKSDGAYVLFYIRR